MFFFGIFHVLRLYCAIHRAPEASFPVRESAASSIALLAMMTTPFSWDKREDGLSKFVNNQSEWLNFTRANSHKKREHDNWEKNGMPGTSRRKDAAVSVAKIS
jgi:hypothetical protein